MPGWDNTQKWYTAEQVRQVLGLKDIGSVYTLLKKHKFAGAVQPFGRNYGWRVPESGLRSFLADRGITWNMPAETTNTGELVARRA